MKLVIQRCSKASVSIDNEVVGEINNGLVVLIGITHEDTSEDIEWLVQKLVNMRIFGDAEGKMNLSLKDLNGGLLLISQFTLYSSTKKGNRPGFTEAARPEIAIPLYDSFISSCKNEIEHVATGKFGADMQVQLINDGPVTILIDSKNRA